MSNDNFMEDLIVSSLEYYDSYQPQIKKIIDKIEYIKFIDNNNLTDDIIFVDKNKKEFFSSSYELLSIYDPNLYIWKWSWSVPSVEKKKNFISRKILDYAFSLDKPQYNILKTTLINSKINIINDLQLDIHLSLSANLSKKPFILKIYYVPSEEYFDEKTKKKYYIYEYEKFNEESHKKNNYIILYLLILDFDE